MGGSVVDKNWLTLLESLSQVQERIGEFSPDEEDEDEEVNASYNYDDFETGSVGRAEVPPSLLPGNNSTASRDSPAQERREGNCITPEDDKTRQISRRKTEDNGMRQIQRQAAKSGRHGTKVAKNHSQVCAIQDNEDRNKCMLPERDLEMEEGHRTLDIKYTDYDWPHCRVEHPDDEGEGTECFIKVADIHQTEEDKIVWGHQWMAFCVENGVPQLSQHGKKDPLGAAAWRKQQGISTPKQRKPKKKGSPKKRKKKKAKNMSPDGAATIAGVNLDSGSTGKRIVFKKTSKTKKTITAKPVAGAKTPKETSSSETTEMRAGEGEAKAGKTTKDVTQVDLRGNEDGSEKAEKPSNPSDSSQGSSGSPTGRDGPNHKCPEEEAADNGAVETSVGDNKQAKGSNEKMKAKKRQKKRKSREEREGTVNGPTAHGMPVAGDPHGCKHCGIMDLDADFRNDLSCYMVKGEFLHQVGHCKHVHEDGTPCDVRFDVDHKSHKSNCLGVKAIKALVHSCKTGKRHSTMPCEGRTEECLFALCPKHCHERLLKHQAEGDTGRRKRSRREGSQAA